MRKYYILGIGFLFVLLLNIIPVFQIQTFNENQTTLHTFTATDRDDVNVTFLTEHFDYLETKDGGKMHLQSNDNFFCWPLDTVRDCIAPHNSTRLQYYNNQNELVWEHGKFYGEDQNIIKDDYSFAPYAITELSNNHIIAAGMVVDHTVQKAKLGIIDIDQTGTINQYDIIDIGEYGYTASGGHFFFDLVSTETGFTMKYSDLFRGSLLINYNNDLTENWYQRLDDELEDGVYGGIYPANFTDTIYYQDSKYYVLVNRQILCLDEEGHQLWGQEVPNSIESFGIRESGNLIVSFYKSDTLDEATSLFQTTEDRIGIGIISIVELDQTDGTFLTESEYKFASSIQYLYPRNIVEDSEGNFYMFVINRIGTSSTEHQMRVLTFDDELQYVGEATFGLDYNNYYEWDHLDRMFYKFDIKLNDETITIRNLGTNDILTTSLSSVAFENQMPISFNLAIYNVFVHTRVVLNYVMTITIIAFVIIEVRQYQQRKRAQIARIEKEVEVYWNTKGREV